MKNIFSIVALIMLVGVCNAQSSNEKENVIETHFRMTHYVNYPAISVLDDNTPSYTIPSYGFLYGRRFDEFLFGIEWDMSTISTSFIEGNESVIDNAFSLLMRHYRSVSENIELYAGILVKTDIFASGYEYSNQNYSNVRLGLGMEFSLGLTYKLSTNSHVGLHAGMNMPCSVLMQKGDNAPDMLNSTDKRAYNGFNLSFNYGFRF